MAIFSGRTEVLSLDCPGGKYFFCAKRWRPIIKMWMDYFEIHGIVLGIGQDDEYKPENEVVMKHYPAITELYSVDFKPFKIDKKGIVWDICRPFFGNHNWVDFIICNAVLEHVIDPFGAMKNLTDILVPGGLMFIFTVGPGAPYHRYPIDCYRFYRDVFIEYAKEFNLKIEDMAFPDSSCFIVYRKNELN